MKKLLTMKERVELYITHRKRVGYTRCSVETGLLKFAKYVDQMGYKGSLTISLAIEWATAFKNASRLSWARRLRYIYGFAKYYQAIDPKTEIPSLNLYGSIYRRTTPYIYSEKEMHALFDATKKLKIGGLRPITFKYLLGLLASTGLRISEAIRLTRQDVDLKKGVLTIRETKCHKSRYVPLHKTTQQALKKYASIRDQKIPDPLIPEFFIFTRRQPLHLMRTEQIFRELRKELGWKKRNRLYDFRHTFVCQRLLRWYQEGKNVDKMMIYLSTYLGHSRITKTYWYLTAIPALMSVVSKRFERYSNSTQGDQ